MTNKFHDAWRGFLNEQEDQTPEESLDSELTEEELAMWQQALKDVINDMAEKIHRPKSYIQKLISDIVNAAREIQDNRLEM